MEKKMETTIVYFNYIGIMEKKTETTIVYWTYIGIVEKTKETTIVYYTWNHFHRSPASGTAVSRSRRRWSLDRARSDSSRSAYRKKNCDRYLTQKASSEWSHALAARLFKQKLKRMKFVRPST